MKSPVAPIISVLCVAVFVLPSCGGGEKPLNRIQLPEQPAVRLIRAIDGNPMKLAISVNSGPEQPFLISSVDSLSLDITGVRLNEQNDIQLVWSEILNGFDVELSSQQQQFLADGDTSIDAPHQHTQYDYDGDGTSNYDERIAGTCVWFTDSDCALDVPTTEIANSPSETVFDIDAINHFPDQSGINVIFNSSMSRGIDGWFTHELEQVTTSNGEICFTTGPGSVFPEHATLTSFQGLFRLEQGIRYTLAADIRGDVAATPSLVLHEPSPTFTNAHKTTVSIDTTYSTVSTSFIAQSEQAVLVSLQFGNGLTSRYCVDNVVLVKGEL